MSLIFDSNGVSSMRLFMAVPSYKGSKRYAHQETMVDLYQFVNHRHNYGCQCVPGIINTGTVAGTFVKTKP